MALASNTPCVICVDINPSRSAPQPFNIISELIGADVESHTKASLACGILYLSQNGLPTAPAIKAVIEDSIKINTPTA